MAKTVHLIKERLETLINKTNVQMNSFYEDISNYYSSIGQTDKVISGRDSYSNGVYTPNGANEFSRKFLINSKIAIILFVINSRPINFSNLAFVLKLNATLSISHTP